MNVEQLKNQMKKDYAEMNAAINQKEQKVNESSTRLEKLKNELLKLEEKRKDFVLGTVKSKLSGTLKGESIGNIDEKITSKKQAIADEEKTLEMLKEVKIHELYDFESFVDSAAKVSEKQKKVVKDLETKVFDFQQEYKRLVESYKKEVEDHNSFISNVQLDIKKYLPVKLNQEFITIMGNVRAPGTYEMLDFDSINKLKTMRSNHDIKYKHRNLLPHINA